MNEQSTTETLDRLFLELSQFTTAKTGKEIALESALERAREQMIDQAMRADTAEARAAIYEEGLTAVAELIAASRGVSGLHMNGDVAPWAEISTGGRFEEWLAPFDTARELAVSRYKTP